MSVSTPFGDKPSLSIIAVKGSPGDILEQYSGIEQGNTSNLAKCFVGCNHQCSKCSGSVDNCTECVDLSTR